MDTDKKNMFEQHAQSIVAAVTLAILVGTGGLLFSMREDVTILKADVRHLTDAIQKSGDDRFRGADWKREEIVIRDRFLQVEKRLEQIERLHANGNHK